MNLVVLDGGDGQDSRLEQEEEEEPVVLDESMLQGQFLLYRAYQGELVKEGETVVLDSFAVQWFAVISSGRAGGQIRAGYYMEQGTRTTACSVLGFSEF